MTKHTDSVEGYDNLDNLAKAIGNMKYDKLAEFLEHLADDVQRQADNDASNGKTKLSAKLYQVAKHLYEAQEDADSAWKICKPYMEKKG